MVGIIDTSRKIGKHRYYMIPIVYQSKATAEHEAEHERKAGYNACVILRAKGYYVYRTKTKK
jgi:hypothetical protein